MLSRKQPFMDLSAALRRFCTRTATKLAGIHKRNAFQETLRTLARIVPGPALT